jgi:hypothetical protein
LCSSGNHLKKIWNQTLKMGFNRSLAYSAIRWSLMLTVSGKEINRKELNRKVLTLNAALCNKFYIKFIIVVILYKCSTSLKTLLY